jgi:ribosomal protein S12 methylthiotransferase accessory factor
MGSAAHPDPEIALFRALAEAIQSRLTLIAGARDDILPGHYRSQRGLGPQVPPTPAGFPARRWAELAAGPASLTTLIESLVERGYRQILAKRLGEDLAGLHVCKIFVPGLGSAHRTRRPPR